MSTTPAEGAAEGATENKKKPAPAAPARKKPAEIDKELRSAYEDVELALIDPGRMNWGVTGFSLSRIPDDNGKVQNVAKVPKNLPPILLAIIDEAVRNRVLAPVSQLDKASLNASKNVQVTSINEDVQVQELSQIDELLHLSVAAFAKQLQELKRKGTTKEFFETMLKEEAGGRNRQEYVELIKKSQ